jgi:mannose-6-phosphate isomerase-like protein (cupin superfamily)
MTSTPPMTRTAIFHARPGHGGPLAERLLHAASLVAEAPGCELWLVHRDGEDPDTVRVGEMWASHTTGATAFSVLDAPDLSKDTSLRDRYELAAVGEARYVREHLGAVQVGLTHYRLRPGHRQGWAHRHGVAEEIYVALSGTGRITVDDDAFELQPLEAVRIAPGSTRELEAGPQGLEVLAFGSHSPGDGEMVADRQRA